MIRKWILFLLLVTTSLPGLILEDMIESNLLSKKKVGYYTGSFDPIHLGHEVLARQVVSRGLCDYVLIVPAWGADGIKERAAIEIRLEMLFSLFAQDPHLIVTSLSPLEVQQVLTSKDPTTTIRGYPAVKPAIEGLEFFGIIGSDTALNLALPSEDPNEESMRQKRLQVFMRGVSIPEKHAETTIGSIMALPVSKFIVGARVGDNLDILHSAIEDRPIIHIIDNQKYAHVSSSKVKQRLRYRCDVSDLIRPEITAIIQKHHLYSEEATHP